MIYLHILIKENLEERQVKRYSQIILSVCTFLHLFNMTARWRVLLEANLGLRMHAFVFRKPGVNLGSEFTINLN